ncbi:aminotransferase class IV [Candidatus Micrarchaeota archaeon]|nr:aminotransferase class IV [Candidatus Micrarchaeota archaeon]
MGETVFLNGKPFTPHQMPVSAFDHGLLYGDGVFEGIRFQEKGLLLLDEHVQRLYDSARMIQLRIAQNPDEMRRMVIEAVRHCGMENGYVRLVVTRGVGDLGVNPASCGTPTVMILVSTISLYPEKFYEEGLRVHVCQTKKPPLDVLPCNAKTCNYLNNGLAALEFTKEGCQEGLMLTTEGFVSEATADNVFGIQGNALFTPSLDTNCLPGITRAKVMELAKEKGFQVREGKYLPDEFREADEVFLTGTGAGIIAVTTLGGQRIGNGKTGKTTRALRDAYESKCRQWLTFVDAHERKLVR